MLDAIQKRESMKLGRTKAAEILTHKDGYQIMLVNRTVKDIIRGRGNKMISHGIEEGEACWAIESILLSRMKALKIPLLAVRIKSNKAIYISRFADWVDHSEIYTGKRRNGSVQRKLSFYYWRAKSGNIKI